MGLKPRASNSPLPATSSHMPHSSDFPGAIDAKLFVARTTELLTPHGFNADNTIACVGVCRDELARPLIHDVVSAWGEAFNFSSLAGLITLGRTGFAAVRSHAPRVEGRERFVFIVMPHIGVDSAGILGHVQRRGQQAATAACGALMSLVDEFRAGVSSAEIDPDDIEQSLLRRRLRPLVASDVPVEIAQLTRVMRRAMLEDLERLLADTDMHRVDYAVFSGVQIHTPKRELVWPADAYVVAADRRSEL